MTNFISSHLVCRKPLQFCLSAGHDGRNFINLCCHIVQVYGLYSAVQCVHCSTVCTVQYSVYSAVLFLQCNKVCTTRHGVNSAVGCSRV